MVLLKKFVLMNHESPFVVSSAARCAENRFRKWLIVIGIRRKDRFALPMTGFKFLIAHPARTWQMIIFDVLLNNSLAPDARRSKSSDASLNKIADINTNHDRERAAKKNQLFYLATNLRELIANCKWIFNLFVGLGFNCIHFRDV